MTEEEEPNIPETSFEDLFGEDDSDQIRVKVLFLKNVQDAFNYHFATIHDVVTVDMSNYEQVGELVLKRDDVGISPDDDIHGDEDMRNSVLYRAWVKTQNFHESWNREKPCRSAMIGDLYEVSGKRYMIIPFGYLPL